MPHICSLPHSTTIAFSRAQRAWESSWINGPQDYAEHYAELFSEMTLEDLLSFCEELPRSLLSLYEDELSSRLDPSSISLLLGYDIAEPPETVLVINEDWAREDVFPSLPFVLAEFPWWLSAVIPAWTHAHALDAALRLQRDIRSALLTGDFS